MWLGRLFHPLEVEQNQIHSRWARLVLVDCGGPHTIAPPQQVLDPRWPFGDDCFIERTNGDFSTSLPVGLHISGGVRSS